MASGGWSHSHVFARLIECRTGYGNEFGVIVRLVGRILA
jgi:hypothetical protein